MISDAALIEKAAAARYEAYAPYSGFAVGAALLGESGNVYSGCNVENLSLGLTMCAERVALGAAIQAGERKFQTIAVTADSKEPIVPCGACRQVLAEFNTDLRIISATVTGQIEVISMAALFPLPKRGILERST